MNHSWNLLREFVYGGMAAWCGADCPDIVFRSAGQCALAPLMRQIVWDMDITDYEQTGTSRNQISSYNTPEVNA
jgi:hypothetical protein